MRFTINPKHLGDLMKIAAKNDVRYYLNGVHIQPAPEGVDGVVLVATDGHRLLAVHQPEGEASEPLTLSLCPADLRWIKAHLKGATKITNAPMIEGRDIDSGMVEIKFPLQRLAINVRRTEGEFPNWQKVIQTYCSTPIDNAGAVNPRYLRDFGGMFLTDRAPFLRVENHGPEDGVVFRWSLDDGMSAIGILMPARAEIGCGPREAPDWARSAA